MQVINKQTDYAIRALIVLARTKKPVVQAREISKIEKIPYAFLRRTLSILAEHRLVLTKEGKGGGVALAKDPKKIRVIDLINIFQGGLNLLTCMFGEKLCFNRARCVLRKKVLEIEKDVAKKFAKITIYKLAKESK
jgi:Rrf2 family protein